MPHLCRISLAAIEKLRREFNCSSSEVDRSKREEMLKSGSDLAKPSAGGAVRVDVVEAPWRGEKRERYATGEIINDRICHNTAKMPCPLCSTASCVRVSIQSGNIFVTLTIQESAKKIEETSQREGSSRMERRIGSPSASTKLRMAPGWFHSRFDSRHVNEGSTCLSCVFCSWRGEEEEEEEDDDDDDEDDEDGVNELFPRVYEGVREGRLLPREELLKFRVDDDGARIKLCAELVDLISFARDGG